MSGKPITKQTPLRCLDCGREFNRLAVHIEHYVEEEGRGPTNTVFERAMDDCLACGSPRVEAR